MARKDKEAQAPAPANARTAPAPRGSELLKLVIDREFGSKAVFGEPFVSGDRAIIPAARVVWGAGGGFGAGPSDAPPSPDTPDEGGGMGYGGVARPAGYLEVTPELVRWHPIVDVRTVVVGAVVVIVVALLTAPFRHR